MNNVSHFWKIWNFEILRKRRKAWAIISSRYPIILLRHKKIIFIVVIIIVIFIVLFILLTVVISNKQSL
jgi:hypothetical protein